MCLESGDGLGLTGLPDNVHGLSDADGHREGSELLVEGDQHPGRDGGGQGVEEVVRLGQDGLFDVEEPEEASHQAGHRHGGHELVVAVVGVEGQGAFAHVDQTLGYPHHKQVVRVLGVVLGQLEGKV